MSPPNFHIFRDVILERVTHVSGCSKSIHGCPTDQRQPKTESLRTTQSHWSMVQKVWWTKSSISEISSFVVVVLLGVYFIGLFTMSCIDLIHWHLIKSVTFKPQTDPGDSQTYFDTMRSFRTVWIRSLPIILHCDLDFAGSRAVLSFPELDQVPEFFLDHLSLGCAGTKLHSLCIERLLIG